MYMTPCREYHFEFLMHAELISKISKDCSNIDEPFLIFRFRSEKKEQQINKTVPVNPFLDVDANPVCVIGRDGVNGRLYGGKIAELPG